MKYDLINEGYYKVRTNSGFAGDDDKPIEIQYGIEVVSERVIRKHAYASSKEGYLATEAVCKHFIQKPDPLVVPVYEFMAEYIPQSRYGSHKYHYDMMRMGTLSEKEKQVISRIMAGWWQVSYSQESRETYFNKFTEDDQKLVGFMKTVLFRGKYSDCHNGNFMKDEDDNYRIIDLEGFAVHTPLEDVRNAWIFE